MQKIPQADLSAFLSNDTSLQNEFVQKIGNSFEEIGFLALKGHFLDSDLQASLYDEINAFFALPQAIKSQYEIEGGGGQRGYTGFGKEHAEGRTVGDLKEFWHFGQDLESHPNLKSIYPDNITVKERDHFNAIGNEVFKKLEQTAQVLLQAIALYLGLEEHYFDKYILEG